MRTARSSSRPGGSPPGTPRDQAPPRTRHTGPPPPGQTLPSRNFVCGRQLPVKQNLARNNVQIMVLNNSTPSPNKSKTLFTLYMFNWEPMLH